MGRTILDRIFGRKPVTSPPEPESQKRLKDQQDDARSAAVRRELLVREVNSTIARLQQ